MRTQIVFGGLVGLLLLSCPMFAPAAIQGLDRVASGVTNPMFVTHAPGDASRLFIAQRGGQIRILDLTTGVLQTTPFLSTTVDTNGEGGLLGLAFHPNYSNPGMPGFGKFYVDVTTGSPFTIRVREFEVSRTDPNVANAGSLREIISVPHTFATNHNGGWIGFSPNDNYLYVATGDGGGGNDDGAGHTPGTGNAQDTTNNLLGKMLRIDVNADDFPLDSARNYAIPPTNPFKAGVGIPGDDVGDDEIWGYGLRNPFRASFDRTTGDLWIGDVGQSQREEIDFQPANSDGAENYGWRLREGLIQTPVVGGAKPPGNVDPVYDYNRDNDQFGGTVVSGGYVYRGPDPDLQGKYFFLDSRNSTSTADDNYWNFDPANPFGTVQNIDSSLTPNVGAPQWPVSFGEDANGNLYIAYLVSGDVYRIRTTVGPGIAASWNVNASGNWSTGGNWTAGAAPNGIDHAATFGGIITANRIVTVDLARTVGTITFNNAAASYTIAGANTLTLNTSSGDAKINVTAGSHTISAPVTLADNTVVTISPDASSLTITGALTAGGVNLTKEGAGTLTVNNMRASALTANAGAVVIAPNGADSGTSVVNTLSVTGSSRLDLNNNDLVVHATAATKDAVHDAIEADIVSAQNGLDVNFVTNWNGAGVTSSIARSTNVAANFDLTALGVIRNSDLDVATGVPGSAYTTFNGQPVSLDDVLVKYTYTGDGNLDGAVTFDDYAAMDAAFFGTISNLGWATGDINFDGVINFDDYAVVDQAFFQQGGPLSGESDAAAVPEPGAWLLAFCFGLTALLAYVNKVRFLACCSARSR